MALSRAQIQVAFQNSLGRAASASDENSYFSVSQSGALTDAQIFSTISNSREADQIADPVIRFYQAAFGRVPDQAGLQNAENFVRALGPSAATYQNLSNMFAQSTEFTNRFGTGTAVDAAYVQALYSTILGRAATSGEVDGYVNTAGATRGNVLYLVSQSNEAISVSDAAVNGFQLNAAQGTAVYTGSIYTAANGQPNTPGSNGQTFALTTGIDNIVGSAGNDTIIGTSNGDATSTLNAGDSINGGAGTADKFTIFTAAGQTVPAGITVSNVEQIFIQNAGTVSTSATQFAGATQLWAQSNTASLTYTDVSTAQTAGIKGNVSGATVFQYANVGGTTDTASLALDSAKITAGSTTVSGIETLNVSGVGTGLTLVDTDLKTLNISATGTTSITANTGNALTTINAGASSGNVTVTSTNTANLAFTGGAGNDKLVLAGTLTNADVINGGAGTDTVSITGADFRVAGGDVIKGINTLTSIETLEFTGGAGDAASVNGDTFTNTGITKLVFNTTGASNDVIELAGARQYAVGALNETAGNLTISQRSGQTTLNLSLEGADADNGAAADVGTVTSNGATTINLSSTGVAGQPTNSVGALSVASNTTVALTGSQELTVAATTIQGAPTLDTAGVNYNGSAFTGKLTVTGSGSIDTIVAGSGGSVIAGGAGADIVTAGSGTDLFQFSGTTAANTSGTLFGQADVINGFAVGTDKLQITGTAEVVSAQQTAVQTAVTGLTAGSTDAAIATAMATANTTANSVSVATFGGNTYALYEAAGGGATGVAANDVFIKLVGVASGVTFANTFVAE